MPHSLHTSRLELGNSSIRRESGRFVAPTSHLALIPAFTPTMVQSFQETANSAESRQHALNDIQNGKATESKSATAGQACRQVKQEHSPIFYAQLAKKTYTLYVTSVTVVPSCVVLRSYFLAFSASSFDGSINGGKRRGFKLRRILTLTPERDWSFSRIFCVRTVTRLLRGLIFTVQIDSQASPYERLSATPQPFDVVVGSWSSPPVDGVSYTPSVPIPQTMLLPANVNVGPSPPVFQQSSNSPVAMPLRSVAQCTVQQLQPAAVYMPNAVAPPQPTCPSFPGMSSSYSSPIYPPSRVSELGAIPAPPFALALSLTPSPVVPGTNHGHVHEGSNGPAPSSTLLSQSRCLAYHKKVLREKERTRQLELKLELGKLQLGKMELRSLMSARRSE